MRDKASIISLGSINADLQYGFDGALEHKGTAPARSFSEAAGGKAANVALFARRMERSARLIGCVGTDHYARVAVDPLRTAGVDLKLYEDEEEPTGVAAIALPKGGDKLILSAPNANMHAGDDYVEFVRDAVLDAPEGSVLVCDYEVAREVLEAAFGAAEERQLPILVDPTFADQVERSDMPRFRAVTPNQQEAGTLLSQPVSARSEAVEAAKALFRAGAEIGCVKLDRGGAAVAFDGGSFIVDTPEVPIRDKTGAGDAFIAAMAIALMSGQDVLEAVRYGVAGSNCSVGTIGAQASYPNPEEFQRMLGRVGGPVPV